MSSSAGRYPLWVATGAAVVGTLLGGAAVYLGRTQQLAEGPATAAGAGAADAEPVADSPEVGAGLLEPSGRGALVAAVDRTRDSVVNLKIGEGFRGAGVVYDASGLVLTNYHVVEPVLAFGGGSFDVERAAPRLVARFSNGRERSAEVVTADAGEDIAVLRIRAEGPNDGFTAAPIGLSSDLAVGEQVFAVGCPLGLEHTVAAGIVSAKDRLNVLPMPVLQLDAAINLGNSGGPLFNLRGELVGITTARASHGEGIGFAIPIDRIRQFLGALEDGDWGRSGVVGVLVDSEPDVSAALAAFSYVNGVRVDRVVVGGPAERAGLRDGDVLVELRGRRYDEFGGGVRGRYRFMLEFGRVVRSLRPGEQLPLTVLRGDDELDLSIEVEAASAARQARIDALDLLGVKLREDRSAPTIEAVLPGSPVSRIPGAEQGLRGFEITGILGRNVASMEELGEVLEKLKRWRTTRRVIRIRFKDPKGQERTIVGYPLGVGG